MNMGTRFIATKEAPVHENVKQAIVNASELDTRLVMRPLRNTERVMNNAAVESLLEKEKRLGDKLKFEDIIDEVAGVYPRIMMEGDMDAGAWSCGMVAGLINDIPTVKELIDRGSWIRPTQSSGSGLPIWCDRPTLELRRRVHARAGRNGSGFHIVPR
jgi:nitronate monooxygenase